jgi:NAD(P)-dependent dehydrogenase (short-subunit alcohol dehydrogenase family)
MAAATVSVGAAGAASGASLQQKLTVPGSQLFGFSAALDGDTMFVGDPADANGAGAAYASPARVTTAPYTAAKHWLGGLTKVMAPELVPDSGMCSCTEPPVRIAAVTGGIVLRPAVDQTPRTRRRERSLRSRPGALRVQQRAPGQLSADGWAVAAGRALTVARTCR